MKKVLIGMMAVFVSVIAMAAEPLIDNVMIQQRWPWSRLVDIDYVLKCDAEHSMDIVISAYNGTELLVVPAESFSGDLNGVRRGVRRIVWDPTMTAYTNSEFLADFRVVLTPTPAPLYMIVDLTKSVGEAGQTEYVYESDLTNGLWGAWVRNPVTNAGSVVKSVVWTGVTTNDIYKTDKFVLRRIPKGEFKMGGSLSTTLTKDFYAGVFEMTQQQWFNVTGSYFPVNFGEATSKAMRPVERAGYNSIRGTAENGGGGWPTNNSVYASSFVGRLRAKTGLSDFDLPTEAQWEYACRAGTTTFFNDGNADASISGVNAASNAWLDALGRYRYNGGYINGAITPAADCGSTNATAVVGSYQPNAWGLYDMHGNVHEVCLDWYDSTKLEGGEDPKGPTSSSSSYRVHRGGSWGYSASACYSGYRHGDIPGAWYFLYGFRLVRTLP